MSPVYGTMGLAMEMLEDAHGRQSKCYLTNYETIEGLHGLESFFLLPITSMRVLSVHNSPREFMKKGLINQARW